MNTRMGHFTIYRDKAGQYRFTLYAQNGELILVSEGYTSLRGCMSGIQSVKMNSPFDERYLRLTAINGEYYFNLKASNGEIIGTSEMYSSKQAREVGIESAKRNAHSAPVNDHTEAGKIV